MELGHIKNLRLNLRTQYNPNTGTKLRKGKKKFERIYESGDIYNYHS